MRVIDAAVLTALCRTDSIVINSQQIFRSVPSSEVKRRLCLHIEEKQAGDGDLGETQHCIVGKLLGFSPAQSVRRALEIRRKLLGSALPGLSIVWDIMKALSAS